MEKQTQITGWRTKIYKRHKLKRNMAEEEAINKEEEAKPEEEPKSDLEKEIEGA